MTRPIRWEIIEHNYDQLVKNATAIRVGTASTEAILRRFTRNASHPVYQAMLELGRAQKTIFIARYLRDRDLQREINEGLNLIESWNRVNDVIFFGKSGEFATNRRDQQQLGMLALHILQAALVYVNTLMLQDILAEPEWQGRAHRRRSTRPHGAVLGARPALRRDHAQHDQALGPQRRRHIGSRSPDRLSAPRWRPPY
jgi:TnpA family transposase